MRAAEPDFQRLLRQTYERGRLRHGLRFALPVVALILVAWWVGSSPGGLVIGGLVFASCVLAGWRGQWARRAALTGLFVGLLPFGCAQLAQPVGHICMAGGCYSACLPLCSAGGFAAGIAVQGLASRVDRGHRFWLAASIMVLAVGSMGCRCLGVSSLLGMTAGLLLASLPVVLWRSLRPRGRAD